MCRADTEGETFLLTATQMAQAPSEFLTASIPEALAIQSFAKIISAKLQVARFFPNMLKAFSGYVRAVNCSSADYPVLGFG